MNSIKESINTESVSSMLKYLRIAVAGLSLTTCLLLIVLWVRSYFTGDAIEWRLSNAVTFDAWSFSGRLVFIGHYDVRPSVGFPPNHASRYFYSGNPRSFWNSNYLGETVQTTRFGFGIQRMNDAFAAKVPHWFCALVLGLVGIIGLW